MRYPCIQINANIVRAVLLRHSICCLTDRVKICYLHPKNDFNKSWYESVCGECTCIGLDNAYFASQYAYNSLFYEEWFYGLFDGFSHLLILQLDAVVMNTARLDEWVNSPYSYVGGPEHKTYNYSVSDLLGDGSLPMNSLFPITLQGLNGGLSLRVISHMVSLLREFPQITCLGRERRIGEDIFFCLLSLLTKQPIFFPNETLASQFAITCNFKSWINFNNNELPFGFHCWHQNDSDARYILNLIKKQMVNL